MSARPKITFHLAAISTVVIAMVTGGRDVDAAELCVRCSGPDASYACVVNTPAATTVDTVVKLYCITALAKAGSHASCAIDRTSSAPCQGTRKELPLPSLMDAGNDAVSPPAEPHGAEAPPAAHAAPNVAPPAQPPTTNSAVAEPHPAKEPEVAAPPKTVQEMIENGTKSAGDGISQTGKTAGDAAKSAGTALGKAGTAVSDAAKSSWKCLSSFFSQC